MSFLIGCVLAIVVAALGRLARLEGDRAFYPLVLVMVASYYVLFAVMDGAPKPLLAELVIMGAFFACIAAGLRFSPWWIAGGLAAHGIMDTFHGALVANAGVPAWWPPFCAGFDVTIAVVMGWMLFRSGPASVAGRSTMVRGVRATMTLALGFVGLVATPGAQAQAPIAPSGRGAVGVALIQTRPVGDLAENIGEGYGVMATYSRSLDRAGWLALRFDVGVAEYDTDSERLPFGGPIGDRVEVRLRTAHTILPMALGLQLTLPTGPLRPYIHAGVGGHLFYTESQIQPLSGGSTIASSINQSDGAAAWIAGGGLYVPMRIKSMRVLLDLGAQYTQGGRQQYLAPGSMIDGAGSGVEISPLESETHMVVIRVGARIGL